MLAIIAVITLLIGSVTVSEGYVIGKSTNLALLRPARQSSMFNIGYASKAVDGHRGTNYFNDGCTETNYEANPWWSVDLGQSEKVVKLEITNRGDCCGNRLHDFDIFVTTVSGNPNDAQTKPLCKRHGGAVAQGATVTIECTQTLTGRYVIIQIPGSNERITLCEVAVFGLGNYVIDETTNLALSRQTFQSSLFNIGYPFKAVDGNKGTRYFEDGCTETNFEANPWWSVDLVGTRKIAMLQITNRGDCCEDRLHDFDIYVTTDSGIPSDAQTKVLCAHYSGAVGKGATVTVKCTQILTGRYVIIQIPGQNERLTMCEVAVYGLEIQEELDDMRKELDATKQALSGNCPA